MRHLAGVFFVLFAVLPGAAHACGGDERAPEALAGFDDFARAVMAEWQVPGLALGIVRDGEPLYCAGYGLGDVKNQVAVTPDTIFAIGSATKAFTATLADMLVDQGDMDWDDPVTAHIPYFTLDTEDGGEDSRSPSVTCCLTGPATLGWDY